MKDRFLSKNLEDATKRLEMFKNKLSLITDSNNEKIKSREQTFKHIMLIYNIEKYLYSLKGIKMRKQQIKYKKLVQSYFLKRNDYDKLKEVTGLDLGHEQLLLFYLLIEFDMASKTEYQDSLLYDFYDFKPINAFDKR